MLNVGSLVMVAEVLTVLPTFTVAPEAIEAILTSGLFVTVVERGTEAPIETVFPPDAMLNVGSLVMVAEVLTVLPTLTVPLIVPDMLRLFCTVDRIADEVLVVAVTLKRESWT